MCEEELHSACSKLHSHFRHMVGRERLLRIAFQYLESLKNKKRLAKKRANDLLI